MWTLENEGDALNGNKLWLRPGKKFLFGRTRIEGETGQFVVSNKSISRKHLTVEVDDVAPGGCANGSSRTKVTLTDLGAKIGTLVNGEQIRGKSHVLDTDANVVSLGRYEHRFIFTWVPVTLSFSFTSKEEKADPYHTLYEQLGPLDIRVLRQYVRGQTTHVVAKTRNTSKGLQALIDGNYVVHNDTFIQALIAAATVPEEGVASPLEEDFVGNFPDPLRFLPPKGKEPTDCGEEAYAPNPNRHNVFEGYTFIFYDNRQYESLALAVGDGQGKALYREVVLNETTIDDFVRYVKGVAGEKGLGEFEDGSEGKGVVVVRFNPVKGAGTEWYAEFGKQVALHLNQRLMEQNEFLNAVLRNDASVLRRPLEIESSGIVAPPPTSETGLSSQTLRSSDPLIAPTLSPEILASHSKPISEPAPAAAAADMPPPEAPRRGRARRTVRREFKGFDDDFSAPVNISSIPEADSMVVDPPPPPPIEESQSQGLFVSQNTNIEEEPAPSQPSQRTQTQTRSTRKRPAPPSFDEIDEQAEAERIAPAAAALKRRRLEEATDRRRKGISTPPPAQPAPPIIAVVEKQEPKTPPKKKGRKQLIDADVEGALDLAREKREKAEQIAKAEREALQEQLEGMDISDIRKLVQVEEMEVVRTRPPPKAAAHADESERWDDKWNGRKNFKKFRRRGEVGRRVINKVIVPLEEVRKRDYGIGDEYWEDGDSQRRRRKEKGKEKERETQEVSQPNTTQASTSRGTKASKSAVERASRILAEEVEEEFEEELRNSSEVEIVSPPAPSAHPSSRKPPPPTSSSRSSRSQGALTDRTGLSQSLRVPETVIGSTAGVRSTAKSTPAASARGESRKRVASSAAESGRVPPAKKVKQAIIARGESDDDSDDDLKFKFKRRG